MKGVKKELHSIIRALKSLVKKTERIDRELDKVKGPRTRRVQPETKVARGRKPGRRGEKTAMDGVYAVIAKSKKGVTTTNIRQKTGLGDKQIWNVINRLKTQRKIKSARRGVYVAI